MDWTKQEELATEIAIRDSIKKHEEEIEMYKDLILARETRIKTLKEKLINK